MAAAAAVGSKQRRLPSSIDWMDSIEIGVQLLNFARENLFLRQIVIRANSRCRNDATAARRRPDSRPGA